MVPSGDPIMRFLFQGMAVLRLLRGFLGWEDFQAGLRVSLSIISFPSVYTLTNPLLNNDLKLALYNEVFHFRQS